jgi:benzoylsuccinyl-CoA thiolase BbsB subunit
MVPAIASTICNCAKMEVFMKQTALREVAVIGVGMSVFGKQPERTFIELATEACRAAIKDAGVNPKNVEGAYCANLQSDFGTQHAVCLGQEVASKVGVVNGEIINVENACAGGSTAIRRTFLDIAMGMYDIGMAFGVDSMTRAMKKGTLLSTEDIEGQLGNSMPAYGAMQMRRHMELYGTTLENFAQVSVKNHHNGCLNPYSQYHEEMTVEQVLNSRVVCDPLTLYMICPFSVPGIRCGSILRTRYGWLVQGLDQEPMLLYRRTSAFLPRVSRLPHRHMRWQE